MNNDFKRSAHHLDPAKSKVYLRDVADLFGEKWLGENDGHRLQILWSRKDHLATTELFGLGLAINKLKGKHKNWLTGLANNIKRQPANAHGFLAELIVCSLFVSDDAVVRPAKKNSPGYDLEIEFEGGFKHLYSIKNHDISLHERKYQLRCAELKAAFSNRMQELKVHGALRIISDRYLEDAAFDRIIDFVSVHLKEKKTYTYLGGAMQIYFVELDAQGSPFATSHFSSEVIVISPIHRNELKNQIDRLRKAVENIAKHVPESENYFRWLWMRVHSSADVAALKKAAVEFFKDESSKGLDGVILIQPSVVRNGDSSQVHTVFDIAARTDHQGFARSVMRGKMPTKLEFPVGSFGQTPPEVVLQTPMGSIKVSSGQYFFQRTDYYVKANKTPDGWLGEMKSPAAGVQFHSVVEFGDQHDVILQGLYPDSEELLFI